MDTTIVGLASEFAVASELCRRDIYAQLTLGHQKRTDLLLFSKDDNLLRIEVKGKQGKWWPNCKGIFGKNVFLVFVDYANKTDQERPDFYVLTVEDWLKLVNSEIEKYKPNNKRVVVDEKNVPVHLDEVNKQGQPYRGMGVCVDQISEHREAWDKIIKAIKDE